jgi:hypothetical protein
MISSLKNFPKRRHILFAGNSTLLLVINEKAPAERHPIAIGCRLAGIAIMIVGHQASFVAKVIHLGTGRHTLPKSYHNFTFIVVLLYASVSSPDS